MARKPTSEEEQSLRAVPGWKPTDVTPGESPNWQEVVPRETAPRQRNLELHAPCEELNNRGFERHNPLVPNDRKSVTGKISLCMAPINGHAGTV